MSDTGKPKVVVGRFMRRAAAFAFFLCGLAHAGPPAGTVISNTASGSAQIGTATQSITSNTVRLTVGTGTPAPVPRLSAQLQQDNIANAMPGATVLMRHTLSNLGDTTDTYTLTIADTGNAFAFTTLELFPDANDDGQPDGTTQVPASLTLAPGQVYHFVARLTVPASARGRITGMATVRATSAAAIAIAPNTDRVQLLDQAVADCAWASKAISQESGPSPGGPLTVTLTYNACDKPRAKVVLFDRLPAGMTYVAGSGRWSGTGDTPLTDAVVGADLQGAGASQIAYDFNVSMPGTVTASVMGLAANGNGKVTFQVSVDPSLAVGTVVPNTARYNFHDANGASGNESPTNTVSYTVTGRIDVELVGQRLPTANPGETVAFTNVLTNRGTLTETFDITLSGSTFPAGTTLALFKADGVTPLADTSGNGIPDTGPVAPGASYNIVVKATIPATAPPASYKVTKTARSVTSPTRSASDDDIVDTLTLKCGTALDPDHQSQVGLGQHVTYAHVLTNRGNCNETVRASAGYLLDTLAGWTSGAYLDTGSIPGVVDPGDTRILPGWSIVLAPGQSARILVDVLAPSAVTANNLTTLSLTTERGTTLAVRDTTMVSGSVDSPQIDNEIRNYTDPSYGWATPWGVIGGNLWLRANARSCNASPTTIDRPTVVLTGPQGEREEMIATETGPDTGIFTLPALPVRAPPVVARDGIVEGRVGDVYLVEIPGCGTRIETQVTLMAPTSTVFDSATNEPVAGAIVTLVQANKAGCSTIAVSLKAANPVVTGPDGHFAFAVEAAGSYCLAVQPPNGYRAPSQVAWPHQPQGRNLDVTGPTQGGSYGTPFTAAAGAPIVIDIPVDAVAQDGLFVQKSVSRALAELGDVVDYTVKVANRTGNALDRAEVILADDLPQGFGLVRGTARRDGRPLADPPAVGSRLTLPIGPLAKNETVTVTYRVRIGPGALQGDGVNRVQAIYTANGTTTVSNVATAKVRVTGGVLGDNGFIVGKLYMDCNANRRQDKGEIGVPGVRILLEDGTWAVTDVSGKYSFYGIANRTHIVKADRTTLPAGATLSAISSRHLGDGGSRIVDLKSGQMHRADFAIAGCEPAVVDAVKARVKLAERADEMAAMAGTQLATVPTVVTDARALPASGVIALQAAAAMPGAAPAAAPGAPFNSVVPAITPDRPSPAPAIAAATSAPGVAPAAALEAILPELDNKLGFVGLADGDTLPVAQTSVRVKGTASSTLRLTVNGEAVSEKQVGKRATLAEKQLQAWEYIGVVLKAGRNTLVLAQIDSFGNPRGEVSITVVAPGRLAKLVLETPAAIADGRTPAKIVVKLFDADGVPVTSRTPITLDATRGKWIAEDLDPATPGLQAFVEGGRGEFALLPPTEAGEGRVAVDSGTLKTEARLDFLPELRQMVAAGVVEGIVNLRNGTRAIQPARASDGFEQELNHLSRTWNDDKTAAGARAAFYLRGKIKGEYLLTAAYDSDKDSQQRLFRDIQPDEFYPIYGDSGPRGYDAQSTSKLYVRVDKDRSYLLWGDFTTAATGEIRKLTNYSRSLTGAHQHYENGKLSVDAFASRDTSRQVIEEIRANGTSGPFQLGNHGSLVNSEKVEIVTRDRNQPALILTTMPQGRFSDYEIESTTGRILMKAPVPSVDRDLNPVFVRVTYEVDQGGEAFWVAGVDAQYRVTDNVQVGGVYVKDKNPLVPFTLAGANIAIKVGAGTYIISEYARSESGLDDKTGSAARIEVKHESKDLKAQAFVARADENFENPGAYLTQGRGESGARAEYRVNDDMSLKAEALRTEDVKTNSVRDGLAASLQYRMRERLTLELGVRHAAERGTTSPIPPVAGQPAPQPMPDEVTSVRARVTAGIPGVENANVYGEAEFDVRDTDRKVIAAGGEYTFANKSRVYARHEFISSITGPYGLNQAERQNTTAVGIDTEYMKDGKLFSEYRIRDAMAGGDVEAALGLRNLFTIAPGLRLGTTFERVESISGTGQGENTALALALEYTGAENWKGSSRLELRRGVSQESLLFTAGAAAKVARDWTALARNSFDLTRNRSDSGERRVERFQAGMAYRDTETNTFNALARVEHRSESDDTTQGIHLKIATDLISINSDWQLNRPFLVSARYAARWTDDRSNGLTSKYRAQVLGARLTWEFASRWDAGLVASVLTGDKTSSRQYGVGVEVGYLVAANLWVSAGYNVLGYRDADMAGADYTSKGAYVRLRYKFDESILGAPATEAKK